MLQDQRPQNAESAINVLIVLIGLGLAASPWLLGYFMMAAAQWNALVVGAVIALLGVGAITAFAEWEEWVSLVLGAWLVVSPWALGFNGVAKAAYLQPAIGVIVVLLAALDLWLLHHRPLSRA